MHVLVCDDDPAARFVAKRWLTSALGCTVTDCEDGVQALELLGQKPFDLALIDLDLPRLNGIEVVEAIRAAEATRELPVVILSQERREDVVRSLVTLGVSAYLLKPLRERTVLGRIGPLLSSRRTGRSNGAGQLSDVRLAPDAPAMLVDGDGNFRHSFITVAAQFGPVIGAESGADALARFRRSPVGLMFVGDALGIMGAEVLVRKIREVEIGRTRIVGLGVPAEVAALTRIFDATMPRAFIPDTIARELRPFIRIPGPLASLEALAPQFGQCLSSAVTQVFGMMGGIEANATDAPVDDGTDSVVSAVTVDVNSRFLLDVELVLSRPVVDEVCVRLLGCDLDGVDEDARMSTTSELTNMVSGRLDAWLKAQALSSHVSLPATRQVPGGEPLPEIGIGDGVVQYFLLPELAKTFTLRSCARLPS